MKHIKRLNESEKSFNDLNLEKLYKALDDIEEIIVDIKEGYLQEFEDEDPVASIKGEFSGLWEEVRLTRHNIESLIEENEE